MSNNKQYNSVEWLYYKIAIKLCNHLQTIKYVHLFKEEFEQAKAMHKEEIMDAQMDTFNHLNDLPYGVDYLTKRDSSEQFSELYYKETFNI